MGRPRKNAEELHTYVGVLVESFDIQSEASLNTNLRLARPILYEIDDLAYEFITTLTITGTCIYPKERKDHSCEVVFRGSEIHAGEHSLTLKDFQARDKHGVHVYKQYRGESIPVFEPPPGIAVINKRRGENAWDSWVCVNKQIINDILITLTHISPVYISIHEKKKDRQRWIQSISVQTSNPEEE